jgi:hypothetical protein
MRFIVSELTGTLPLLAAKGLSASPLCCVQAAKRPQGLGLDTYRRNTLLVCGATPALTVCTAWPTQAICEHSGSHHRDIYESNSASPLASIAQGATEFIVNDALLADMNHLTNPAQAVPALARQRGRSFFSPLERYAARCGASRALELPRRGREHPWGADGLPRRWLAAQRRPQAGWAGAHT